MNAIIAPSFRASSLLTLAPRYRLVLEARMSHQPESFQSIGKRLGVSKQRVFEIERLALQRLGLDTNTVSKAHDEQRAENAERFRTVSLAFRQLGNNNASRVRSSKQKPDFFGDDLQRRADEAWAIFFADFDGDLERAYDAYLARNQHS